VSNHVVLTTYLQPTHASDRFFMDEIKGSTSRGCHVGVWVLCCSQWISTTFSSGTLFLLLDVSEEKAWTRGMWSFNNLCRSSQAIASAVRCRNNKNNLLQRTVQRQSHSVRLIAVEDLPHGKGYKGDVLSVKAGYARNYLIPQKKAVYATPQNFVKMGIVDPDLETEEQRITRLQRESSMDLKAEQYLKEADMLKKYLRNKVVRFLVFFSSVEGAFFP